MSRRRSVQTTQRNVRFSFERLPNAWPRVESWATWSASPLQSSAVLLT
jgi:hypothetical protein